MALLGDDGRDYKLARKLESVEVWRTWLGESDEDKLHRVMDELDSDHDAFISLIEFAAFCRSSSEDGGASKLRDAFKLYDQDQNGLIFASELHLFLNCLGMKCSVKDCHRMIRSIDSDGNGNVNFEEFQIMMTIANANNSNASPL